MPRVSEEYRAGRRAEIVSAAARLFAANGFHATSMADIITECGLSAGAVYRYFRGKEELIGAVAETALGTADEVFRTMLADGATPSPQDALAKIIRTITDQIVRDPTTGVDLTRVGLQVWAEALRSPQLAARANDVYLQLRGHFAEVARRWQAAGNLPAEAVPEQVGSAMLSLVQGFVLQRLLINDTNPGDYIAGVRWLLPAEPSSA
ncbi:TetR/AcrR family transcriptional regulator [Actinoplanes sp. GCM10030250]|uniref:TetR/AcrR family transcriptional regulator n=1 Tax=Actinoplanes sp. GCM10030250 TaxID=3273376 RepID=UPI00361AC1C1